MNKQKFKDANARYTFLIENWEKYTNAELSKILGVRINTVAQMARIARVNGVKLVKKSTKEWPDYHKGVKWKELKK